MPTGPPDQIFYRRRRPATAERRGLTILLRNLRQFAPLGVPGSIHSKPCRRLLRPHRRNRLIGSTISWTSGRRFCSLDPRKDVARAKSGDDGARAVIALRQGAKRGSTAAANRERLGMYHGGDTGFFGLLELPFLFTAVFFAFRVAAKLEGGSFGAGMFFVAWGFLVMALVHLVMQIQRFAHVNILASCSGRRPAISSGSSCWRSPGRFPLTASYASTAPRAAVEEWPSPAWARSCATSSAALRLLTERKNPRGGIDDCRTFGAAAARCAAVPALD